MLKDSRTRVQSLGKLVPELRNGEFVRTVHQKVLGNSQRNVGENFGRRGWGQEQIVGRG